MAEGPFELYAGQSLTTFQVTVRQGALLQVHVNDPQQIFAAVPAGQAPSGLDQQLELILRPSSHQAHRMRLVAHDSSGRTYAMTVPTGSSLGLTVKSASGSISDVSGNAVAAEIPLNIAPNAVPAQVSLTIHH